MTSRTPLARTHRLYPSRLGSRIRQGLADKKSDGWERGLDRNPVATYLELLTPLGLTDPTDAHVLHSRASELHTAARQPSSPPPTIESNARALATGTMTIAELDKQLARVSDRDSARRTHRLRKDTLNSAAHRTYKQALASLAAYGDRFITENLRPLVDAALDTPGAAESQTRWHAAHRLVAHLRSIGAVPSITGANALEAALERPDLAYLWHVDTNELDETPVHRDGHVAYMAYDGRVPVPPLPVLTARRAAWRPGIFTASEILEQSHVWDQDADLRRLAFPDPHARDPREIAGEKVAEENRRRRIAELNKPRDAGTRRPDGDETFGQSDPRPPAPDESRTRQRRPATSVSTGA